MSVERLMILKIASVLCIGQGVGCLVFDREMLEEVHPIPQYVQRTDDDLDVLVALGYIHQVPTQNTFGDDPPLLGGSPLFDYTEVMPDVEYLLKDMRAPNFKHGRMNKRRAGDSYKGETREFVFKNDVLYWWAHPTNPKKKPRGSIRFDSRIITRPEARNPQLLYAVGVSPTQNKRAILVKTNRKVYDLRPPTPADCDEWVALFERALASSGHDNDTFTQTRHRMQTEADPFLDVKRNDQRASLVSMRQFNEMYEVVVKFPEEFEALYNLSETMFELYPAKTTAQDMITSILEENTPDHELATEYHLLVEGCSWPLYGSNKLWENHTVRVACATNTNHPVEFQLVRSDETHRYSRMPNNKINHDSYSQDNPIVIKVKLPANQQKLRDIQVHANLNETTVRTTIEACLVQLAASQEEENRQNSRFSTILGVSQVQEIVSQDYSDWMLRLVGSDIHMFGTGLLAEYEAVREAFDEFGEIAFQLLRIKPDAKKAMRVGKTQLTIYRFYAFSYGFMRDIIYRQMLHPHRVNLHGRCAKHLKLKVSEDRESVLNILQNRHDKISQRPIISNTF